MLIPNYGQASTADHSKFEQLDEEFDYAPDITLACLECHTEAAKEVHDSFHWKWAKKIDDQDVGKSKGAFNNYCVSARGNAGCTQCHAGYGWRNDDFDLEEEENVDCLVCHDQTGTYKKSGKTSGHPVYEEVDLKAVAQSVAAPTRKNCLTCHANGGGGNGTKHGDTDMSLVSPDHGLDVHMAKDGVNFSCQTCHQTSGHITAGRYYDKAAFEDYDLHKGRKDHGDKNVTCESCHSEKPHQNRKLDNHTTKVACTSCHIPEMARGGFLTKLSWDWSTATQKDEEGKPYTITEEFDGIEAVKYTSKKGTFNWGQNVVPQYRWYKGELKPMTYTDKIDPNQAPIDINPPTGDYKDPMAKIWPFKIHQGKQPYDIEHNTILPMALSGKKGSGALWSDYDWDAALTKGAELNELPFSGKYDFIETNGYWPIKHMVAPKDKTLKCTQCHSKDSRLNGLNDFYLLGRDANPWVEKLGLLMVIGGLLGVIIHSFVRYVMAHRRRKGDK